MSTESESDRLLEAQSKVKQVWTANDPSLHLLFTLSISTRFSASFLTCLSSILKFSSLIPSPSSPFSLSQVEDITRENLAKVANRGENLDDLQRRTDVLSQSASEFSYTARRIQQKYCWQNVKLWIVILFILIIILVVLIIALVAAINH
jgi:hypothetical protein